MVKVDKILEHLDDLKDNLRRATHETPGGDKEGHKKLEKINEAWKEANKHFEDL